MKTQEVKNSFNYFPERFQDILGKSTLNNLRKKPRLFDGMNFYIVDHQKPIRIFGIQLSKSDLMKLIAAGDGKNLHRAPALRTVEDGFFYPYHINRNSDLTVCSNYIIYDEEKPPKLKYNMKELRHKSSRWLIESILSFEIITT